MSTDSPASDAREYAPYCQAVSSATASGVFHCMKAAGHAGDHSSGIASWPSAPSSPVAVPPVEAATTQSHLPCGSGPEVGCDCRHILKSGNCDCYCPKCTDAADNCICPECTSESCDHTARALVPSSSQTPAEPTCLCHPAGANEHGTPYMAPDADCPLHGEVSDECPWPVGTVLRSNGESGVFTWVFEHAVEGHWYEVGKGERQDWAYVASFPNLVELVPAGTPVVPEAAAPDVYERAAQAAQRAAGPAGTSDTPWMWMPDHPAFRAAIGAALSLVQEETAREPKCAGCDRQMRAHEELHRVGDGGRVIGPSSGRTTAREGAIACADCWSGRP